jgi:TonB family protein
MSEFYEGLACVSETDGEAERWGYIDVTGKWAIPPQYDMAERFSGGYAVVQPPANSDSSAGRSRVRVTFIDRLGHATGSVHVDTTDGLGCYPEFSDGLVAVRRDGRWGFVDHMGHQVIDARFDRFCPPVFSSGRAVVRENGRLIAIDRTGRTAFVFDTAKYGCDPPYGFGEGLAMVIDRRSQRLGYIDTTGRLVIPCVFSPGVDRFNVIGGFHEGLAPAALKRRVGFINKAGDFVVEPKFAYAERYSEGTAVTFAGLPNAIVVFIGRNGKCTGAPKVDVPLYEKPNEVLSWEWGEFKGGLVRLGKGRKASYFDRRGRMVSAVWLDDSVAHGAVHSAGSEGFAESQSRSAPTVQVDSSGPGGSPAVVPFWKTERKPVPIDIPVPDYPAAARKAGVQGQAVVEALVDVDGSVADARILKSAGDQSLDLAGLATARRAKFRPACYRGAIVRCWVSIPFRFKP